MKYSYGAVLLPAFAASVNGIQLDADSDDSIKSCSSQYANGLMSYYKANSSSTAAEDVGIFPDPVYWWEAGAVWGGMIEYTNFVDDQSYVQTVNQALRANQGPANDIIVPARAGQTGNDDQAFWAFAFMSALEYEFPDSDGYLETTENAFNNIIGRWKDETCGGGLTWQFIPANNISNPGGMNYKNAISNGATFALAARLARYTGNQTYADWAEKIFKWSQDVGLISDEYQVFDGTDDRTGCKTQDKTEWSYNLGVYMHGAAVMYDVTKGDDTWKTHVQGFLDHASTFFKGDIMYEAACETGSNGRTCNLDQQSFKAYLSRFLAKTAIMAPFTADTVYEYLHSSAVAAAKVCTGENNACGSKWYTGSFDSQTGIGQQLSAMEVTQALLTLKNKVTPVKKGSSSGSASSSIAPSSTAAASSSPASSGASSMISTAASGSSTASPAEGSASASPVSQETDSPVSTSPAQSQGSGQFIEHASASGQSCTIETTYETVYATPTSTPLAASSVCTIETTYTTVYATPTPTPSTLSTTCITPSATVTVYVPPVAVTPTSVPVSNVTIPSSNGTVPLRPSNTTMPVPEFTGAGSSTKTTAFSCLAFAAAILLL